MDFYIIKVLFFTTLSFFCAFFMAPALIHYLYKYKMGKSIRNDGSTPIFSKLHAHKAGTPVMGGILVWGTVVIFAFVTYFTKFLSPEMYNKFNFITRAETLLPLGALVFSALVGLLDDWLDAKGKGKKGGGGLTIKHRLAVYTMIALGGAWWFYSKLGWDLFHVPFVGTFEIGISYIFIFIFIIVATSFSVNETDGLDGLAGGVLLTSFASYGVIAFFLERYNLAVFCGVIVGALLAFLWFNIMPARFYMGDTGSMSLGVTLGVIAMLTNSALILPIIGSIFVLESASVIIQILSKKFRKGKKVFRSAPIHHHFEAKGWPEAKIVMRFWVIAGVSAAVGVVVFLLDKTF